MKCTFNDFVVKKKFCTLNKGYGTKRSISTAVALLGRRRIR